MTHPLEHLAGAVDGALTPADRATLVEHLRSCASCRDEVRVAAAARDALRATPTPDAPDLAAIFAPDRIASLAAPSPTVRPSWSRVVPALAAAAVVAVVALVVPRLGTSSNDASTAASGPGVADLATDGPVRLQVDDTDYDDAALSAVATEVTAALNAALNADATAATEVGAEVTTPSEQRFAGTKTRQAVACLNEAFPGYPGEFAQVRQATFEGEAAYLGVVLESVQTGAPADTVSIWVAAIEDCSILSLTSNHL